VWVIIIFMDQEPEKLSESLMHSVVNDYSSEALIDLGESFLDDAADSLVKSDALTKIPILGALVGLTKGALVFRDRRYANKLLGFLAETSKASEDDKRKYRKKLDKNPEECHKAGEVILDIIDKITSTEKAVMVGKLFRAFMHEDNMTTAQLIYLCEIIERAYLQDLQSLQKSEVHNDVNLENIGVKKPLRSEDIDQLIGEALKHYEEQQDRNMQLASRGISPATPKYPRLTNSGLTEEGYNLQRILRTY